MRTRISVCALAMAAFSALAGSAAASNVEDLRARFKEIDANGDRALQFSEIRAARARMFDRIDIDGNGVLDPEEIDAVRQAAQARQGQARWAGMLGGPELADRVRLLDTDRDGRISRAEFSDHVPERLLAADKNGDQALSRRELRALKRDAKTANAQ